MPTFDQNDADCIVYVYRKGIAAAVGHDLAIEATEFEVEIDEEAPSVEARFAADKLKVRHAMDDGEPNPGALSDKDRRKIEGNIRDDVLETKRHPVITFRSTDIAERGDKVRVEGVLKLHGVERTVAFDARSDDGAMRAGVALNQPAFDIEPYSALLGALKLKPEVDVEVTVPWEAGSA